VVNIPLDKLVVLDVKNLLIIIRINIILYLLLDGSMLNRKIIKMFGNKANFFFKLSLFKGKIGLKD
jgi:hypothetical protein